MSLLVGLWFAFRYYLGKARDRAFLTLVAGDTQKAYELWKPKPSYRMEDFIADWGDKGYFGPVKSYKILRESSPIGSNAVEVAVALSPFSPMPDPNDLAKRNRARRLA